LGDLRETERRDPESGEDRKVSQEGDSEPKSKGSREVDLAKERREKHFPKGNSKYQGPKT
jgi:hypothetical protein